MVKVIVLIKRKPGLSRGEFVRYYEEVHAPLALRCLPYIKRYVRNHIIPPPGVKEPEFDCVTEEWYEDNDALNAAGNLYHSSAGQAILDDELRFMDRSKMVSFVVDEKVSR